jgi:hypothetical protein
LGTYLGEFWAIKKYNFAQRQKISPKWRNFAQSGNTVTDGRWQIQLTSLENGTIDINETFENGTISTKPP